MPTRPDRPRRQPQPKESNARPECITRPARAHGASDETGSRRRVERRFSRRARLSGTPVLGRPGAPVWLRAARRCLRKGLNAQGRPLAIVREDARRSRSVQAPRLAHRAHACIPRAVRGRRRRVAMAGAQAGVDAGRQALVSLMACVCRWVTAARKPQCIARRSRAAGPAAAGHARRMKRHGYPSHEDRVCRPRSE